MNCSSSYCYYDILMDPWNVYVYECMYDWVTLAANYRLVSGTYAEQISSEFSFVILKGFMFL